MMALDYYMGLEQQGYNEALRTADSKKLAKIGQSLKRFVVPKQNISSYISSGKYAQACAQADSTAKQLGLDLQKAKFLTMEDLATTGGRRPGGKCNMEEATIKLGEVSKRFADAAARGVISNQNSHRFGSRMEEIGSIMSYDPSEACERFDALVEEFGL
jgi:hypothetical protein